MTLNLEEDLLCKVLRFAGIMKSDEEMERIDETAHDPQHALIAATRTAKRFYFGTLKLALNQVKLSVTRSHKLSHDLVAVKRKLGLSLIAFEDALIDLDPFIRVHPFETINFLTNSVVKHYTDELLSQAVLILGATDFLGKNSMGNIIIYIFQPCLKLFTSQWDTNEDTFREIFPIFLKICQLLYRKSDRFFQRHNRRRFKSRI